MRDGQFWLTEEQFAKIEPHLPKDTRGKDRVDDRRVISGIVQVLISGGRWVDARRTMGHARHCTIALCAGLTKGIWVDFFDTLARAGGPALQVMIDCWAVKAHRSAAGGKGGRKIRRSAVLVAGEQPKSML